MQIQARMKSAFRPIHGHKHVGNALEYQVLIASRFPQCLL